MTGETFSMTEQIQISVGSCGATTEVSNVFIDEYMPEADGAFVKVYIYLLRCVSEAIPFSVKSLSDKLGETKETVLSALRYWESTKLLYITWSGKNKVKSITFNPLTNQLEDDDDDEEIIVSGYPAENNIVPITATSEPSLRPNYSIKLINSFKQQYSEFDSLIDYIESKMGCTLSVTDLQTPAYLFEDIGMSADLIRYLYDYCIEKTHGSCNPKYIETVGFSWHSEGLTSVDAVKAYNLTMSKASGAVRNGFGLKNRDFNEEERGFIKSWVQDLKMNPDMIKKACIVTLSSTGKQAFKYADKCLTKWSKAGYTEPGDIPENDSAYEAAGRKPAGTVNRFNQFQQTEYTKDDYDDLEFRRLSGN